MSTLQELVARARQQTAELRHTLTDLANVEIEAPTHAVPEIERALATLHAIKNGYALTEVLDPKMQDFMDGKIEGLDSAIEALEGRGATKKRGGKRTKAPAVARSSSIFDISTDVRIAEATPKPHTLELTTTLVKGEIAVLVAIGQCGDRGATHAHIGLLTTYKSRSRENYLGMLRQSGLAESAKGRHYLTDDGKRELENAGFQPRVIADLLSKGETEVITVIARGDHRGVTKGIIALETPYKARSVDNYVATLGVRELIETRDGRQYLTAFGRAMFKALIPAPLHGLELRNRIREEISEGEAIVFETIEETGHNGITKAHLVAELDAKYKTRSIENYLGTLSTRELVTRTEGVYALEDRLFAKG